MLKKLRQWSYHRQYLGKRGTSPKEVLPNLVGVYSAHPSGPLSLYARVKDFQAEDFYALDTNQLAFRMPSMRTSVYQLPAADAPKIFAATIEPASSGVWEKRYSQDGRKIPVEHYEDWKEDLLKCTQKPLTVKELKQVTIVPDDKLKFVLNRMAFEGFILRVGAHSLRSNIISYVAAEAWGGQFDNYTMAEGQEWLAKAYLKAFGPARVKDFQWWAGITATQAKTAIAKLETIELDNGLMLLAEDQEAFETFTIPDSEQIDLLPQWDCYTMGYAPDGRKRFIADEGLQRLYGKLGATGGNALGAVMINGQVQGVWTSRFKGKKMEVILDSFSKITGKTKSKVEKAFQEIALLLESREVVINPK
jgi:hypothetical protein